MTDGSVVKAAMSVSEMAKAVQLSRSRFYGLIGTAFPAPSRNPESGRPYYTEEQQQVCLEVRRRNCGIDGRPILFYAPRSTPTLARRPVAQRTVPPKAANRYSDILEAVRGLGLASATAAHVEQAVQDLFPQGTAGIGSGELIRSVFVRLARQNSSDKVGG